MIKIIKIKKNFINDFIFDLKGFGFSDNKIICKSYDGPINEPVKNFSYLKDLIKCKIKLLISYIQWKILMLNFF